MNHRHQYAKSTNGELRLPPHSRDAERSLVAALIRQPALIPDAIRIIEPLHCYGDAHTRLLQSIYALHFADQTVDLVTVAEWLKARKWLDDVSLEYLVDLPAAGATVPVIRDYARIILNKFKLRKALEVAHQLTNDAYEPNAEGAGLLNRVGERIREISEGDPLNDAYRFAPMTSAEFLQQDYRLSWYVQHILVAGQPCVLGGPKKSLKTNILIDLALSLGSATPFLGKFKVYNRVRTAFISGESGGGTIRETALRIAASKGIELADADVLWDLRLPRLGNDAELAELVRGIKAKGVKVLIIDPLYLSLLPEAGGADAANLYQMGPLLCRVGKACLDAGVTPILAHHAKKNRLNNYDPLDLDDLAFSGIAEYSRQWLLVNRASSYDADKPHRLHLVAGGSVGHGGLWTLSIDEGKLDENFQGRVWNVEVLTASESRDNKAVQQAMKEREKEVADEAKLLGTLDSIDPDRVGVSYTHAREVSGLARRMPATLERLKTQNLLEEIKDFRTLSGRPARGIRRSPKETSGTSG